MQVSSDYWPLPGWKAGTQPQSSITISLLLQDAEFGALDPLIYYIRAGCPAQYKLSIISLITILTTIYGTIAVFVSGSVVVFSMLP
jgi:hypothetical protein